MPKALYTLMPAANTIFERSSSFICNHSTLIIFEVNFSAKRKAAYLFHYAKVISSKPLCP
jgi:hypothetical protein